MRYDDAGWQSRPVEQHKRGGEGARRGRETKFQRTFRTGGRRSLRADGDVRSRGRPSERLKVANQC
jgi:hypothetical protein